MKKFNKFITSISLILLICIPAVSAIDYGVSDTGGPTKTVTSSNWKPKTSSSSSELSESSTSSSEKVTSSKSSSSMATYKESEQAKELDNQRSSNGYRTLADTIFYVGGLIALGVPLVLMFLYCLARTNSNLFQRVFTLVTFKRCNAHELKPFQFFLRLLPIVIVGTLLVTGQLKWMITTLYGWIYHTLGYKY